MTKLINVGIDEAARGSIAGPMVFCIFTHMDRDHLVSMGAKDSKISTEAQRSEFYARMCHHKEKGMANWTYARITPAQMNLSGYTASIRMTLSGRVNRFVEEIDGNVHLMMDGTPIVLDIPPELTTEFIPRGDSTEPLISAASMMAKAYHDRYMKEINEVFPEWEFDSHKGYCSEAHFNKLYDRGPLTIHRVKPTTTFVKNQCKKKGLPEPGWLAEFQKRME